jgi:ectoine hydroxylase-related dioxygenase (phytanoyl-CoA dioxygenase family)
MLHAGGCDPDVEKIASGAAQSLNRDGYAILEAVATSDEVAEIRRTVTRIMRLPELKRRELGERGGVPQIVEIEDVLELSPDLQKCGFFARAKEISAKLLKAPAEAHYNHVIFKPPMNMKETAWHQDAAYGRRLTFSSRRLHWWLPLHDVGCFDDSIARRRHRRCLSSQGGERHHSPPEHASRHWAEQYP